MEVTELVSELGDSCEVMLKTMDDDLSVCLGEMKEVGGSLKKFKEQL